MQKAIFCTAITHWNWFVNEEMLNCLIMKGLQVEEREFRRFYKVLIESNLWLYSFAVWNGSQLIKA